MSRDAKLAELAADLAHELNDDVFSDVADELFASAALGLTRRTPTPSLRDRLLAGVAPAWHRYEAAFASLIDLDLGRAREILGRAENAEHWVDGPTVGISLFHIDAGPARQGADVGLVRLGAGVGFPRHSHLGNESILVLDGTYRDGAGYELSPGNAEQRDIGEDHDFVAGPHGVVFAVVLYEGVAFPNPNGGPPIVYRG